MITCQDCRFWIDPRTDDTDRAMDRYRYVKVAGLNELFGLCTCEKFKLGYGHDEAPADEVVIENDEGWGFYTGPEFGCIHAVLREA